MVLGEPKKKKKMGGGGGGTKQTVCDIILSIPCTSISIGTNSGILPLINPKGYSSENSVQTGDGNILQEFSKKETK
jgi:hypothetical protein